jgi:hypothetical protein
MRTRTVFAAAAVLGTLAFAASAQAAYLTLGTTNTSSSPTTLTGSGAPELKVVETNASNQAVTALAGGGSGIALFGTHTTAAGAGPAVQGSSASTAANAYSLLGLLSSSSPGANSAAVRGQNNGTGGNGYGVWGSQAGSGTGVYGFAPSGRGLRGVSTSGTGVWGQSTSGTGLYGLHSSTAGAAPGVRGQTSSSALEGAGVVGTAASTNGVLGTSAAQTRAGVAGRNSGGTGVGVLGCANYGSNYELYCHAGGDAGGTGGFFSSGATANGSQYGTGVEAYGWGTSGTGVYAQGGLFGVRAGSEGGHGVHGESSSGDGVYGLSVGTVPNAGVEGHNSGSGDGVLAGSTNGPGLYAYSTNGSAGYFEGPVTVTGTLTKPAGSFRIDHPLDPQNKYLQHSFVESPDMLNVYNGNVTTNKRGFATVRLPRYFQALNRSFRYQLTAIGKPGQFVQAMIVREIAHNSFTLETSKPHVKVSWQVTGIRHDRYANAHRIQVVVPKAKKDQGRYLHPELYGKPRAQAIGYQKPRSLPRRPAPTR